MHRLHFAFESSLHAEQRDWPSMFLVESLNEQRAHTGDQSYFCLEWSILSRSFFLLLTRGTLETPEKVEILATAVTSVTFSLSYGTSSSHVFSLFPFGNI